MAKAVSRGEFYGLLGTLGLVLAIVLAIGGGLALKGRNFATSQVHTQLIQEKITFPPAGSKGLDPAEFPGLQQYAGQPVDTGPKAKAYANEFIWVHMMTASGGKTYAEVSAASQAAPTDTKLAALKNVLFQGDMLRSSLLTAYAFSVFGVVAGYAAVACILASGLLFVLSLLALAKAKT